ncbi:hypothetical protein MSG28_008460 [Choristoneura fumiferana]|uniref:Uncharacterized protein n=1 Tax=Choristoneura fumiferana TaxID=7141 RepID=A0ACC0J6R4_CHOFU|nr:hypothetical protein MSG28_008460 [Choristoneura fumiferana]
MQEIDDALKACTFGRFHIQMLATALVGLVASVLVSNSTAYLLPNAECDLRMDLLEKGMLNAMPYIGMMLSSLIAGFLTDTFGRRLFLVYGYGGIFLFTLLAGSSQSYEVLLTAKFFEGILFIIIAVDCRSLAPFGFWNTVVFSCLVLVHYEI